MVWKAETRLLKMVARHALRSLLPNPPALMIRICLRTVDLPLSPAPASPCQCVCSRDGGRSRVRTEQQELHLALSALPVHAEILFDVLISSRLRICGFPAKAHDGRCHISSSQALWTRQDSWGGERWKVAMRY